MVFLSKIVETFLFLGDLRAFGFMLLTLLESTKQSTAAPTQEGDSLYRHQDDRRLNELLKIVFSNHGMIN